MAHDIKIKKTEGTNEKERKLNDLFVVLTGETKFQLYREVFEWILVKMEMLMYWGEWGKVCILCVGGDRDRKKQQTTTIRPFLLGKRNCIVLDIGCRQSLCMYTQMV